MCDSTSSESSSPANCKRRFKKLTDLSEDEHSKSESTESSERHKKKHHAVLKKKTKCLTPKAPKKCTAPQKDVYKICYVTDFHAKAIFNDKIVVNSIESTDKLSVGSFTKFNNCVKFKNNCKFLGDVMICEGTSLRVNKITSCCGDPVNLDGDLIVRENLISSNIRSYNDEPININSSINVNGTITADAIKSNQSSLSLCGTILQVSQINPCSGSGVIINNLIANNSFHGTMRSMNGFITMEHPLTVEDKVTATELSACLGIATNLLTSCTGNEITCESDMLFEENIKVSGQRSDFCSSVIYVQTLTSCDSSGINLIGNVNLTSITSPTSNITINSDIMMCDHSITASRITGCNGTLNLVGIVNVDTLLTSSITACAGVTTNILSSCAGNLIISNNTNVQGTLETSQLSTNSIISSTNNLNIGPNTTVSGVFTACNLVTGTIQSCNGTDITIVSPLIVSTIGSETVLTITSDIQACGYNLGINSITSCGTSNVSINPGITTTEIISQNYNLVHNSLGSGISILGSAVGPGGNTRTFKSLTSNTINISSTNDTVNLDIDTLTNGANLGTGAEVYSSTSGNTLFFKTITNSDGKLNITDTASSVVLDLNSGAVTGSNLGTGASVYNSSVDNDLKFNTLVSTSPELVISTTANEVTFNSSFINNAATGTFTAPATIVPKTWTSFINPTISGGSGNFSVTANGIQSTLLAFKIIFTFQFNMNNGPNSLSSIGASFVLVRFVNAGNIISNETQVVFSDNSVNDIFTNAFIVDYDFFDVNQASNAIIQIWHNGTSNWNGATQVSYIINNV